MTLSQRHRSSIYQSLSPVLGEEEAEAMLAEFPANEGNELVTKDFLRAELGELRTELHAGLRQQTVWMVGTVFAAMSLLLALSAALR